MTVNSAVAQRDNDLGLGKDRFAGGLFEARLVGQSRDVVLIRQIQSAVEFASPVDRQFDRATRLEAGRARIGDRRLFGLRRRFVDVAPLGS